MVGVEGWRELNPMLVSGGIPRGRSPKLPGLGSRPSLQLLYLGPYLEGM